MDEDNRTHEANATPRNGSGGLDVQPRSGGIQPDPDKKPHGNGVSNEVGGRIGGQSDKLANPKLKFEQNCPSEFDHGSGFNENPGFFRSLLS